MTPPIQFAHVPSRKPALKKRIFVACALVVALLVLVALLALVALYALHWAVSKNNKLE